MAERFLRRNGYDILARNYRCPCGELDIVARDGEIVVFVEIKGKTTGRFGSPLEAITPAKQRRLALVANYYLTVCKLHYARTRFDVVGVRWIGEGEAECVLVRDAFRTRG